MLSATQLTHTPDDTFQLRIDLNQLPHYSPWPKLLIESSLNIGKRKTKQEILREFERDKWGSILDSLKKKNKFDFSSLDQALHDKDCSLPISIGDELFLSSVASINRYYRNVIADELAPYLPSNHIVELGAGAGNLIIPLAISRRTEVFNWYAYELSRAGREVIARVSAHEKINIQVNWLDFDDSQPYATPPPNGAVFFTSFSLAYAHDAEKFLRDLITRNPKAVVLLEPIYQHYSDESLLGLLRRRYHSFNDYSQRILPGVRALEEEGLIRITSCKQNVFGHNPLCPVSALHLSPRE